MERVVQDSGALTSEELNFLCHVHFIYLQELFTQVVIFTVIFTAVFTIATIYMKMQVNGAATR